MIADLQKIWEAKNKNKSQLINLKDKYLAIIYEGLINKKPRKDIHKELITTTLNSKKQDEIVDTKMLQNAIKCVNIVDKRVDTKLSGDELSILVFTLLNKIKADKILNKNINNAINSIEGEGKQQVINDYTEHNRKLKDPKIFYLASKHLDSASDHKQWQGHYYYDKDWRKYVRDEETQKKVRDIIAKHNMKTMQWVTGKPVWFITRPNCRHYFVAFTLSQVEDNTISHLLRQNKMYRQSGARRYIQTLKSGVGTKERKLMGEQRNAELMIERYKERLTLHKELAKVRNNRLLKDAIKKDKMLIDKWQKYLKKLSGY